MTINAANVTTHFQKIGQGPALILLHGWGGDWQSWSPLIPALSEHYQLIIPDLPAFGRSQNPPTPWNSQQFAEWLQLLVQGLELSGQVIVAGHSFGGKIAARWAAKYQPAQLRALIIIDASGLPDQLTPRQQLTQTISGFIPSQVKEAIPHTLKAKWLTKLGSATDHLNSTPFQRQILKVIVREDISSELTLIKAPTLIIWGEHDSDTPLHQGQKFAKLIPQSQFIILKGAGHFSFQEQPKNAEKAVTNFLQNL